MSGGPNTILQVTARQVARGSRIRYVAAFGAMEADVAKVRAHIHLVTGVEVDADSIDLVDASAPGAVLRLGKDDVPLASWWPTAHIAEAALAHVRAREFVYVVQDFEPGFYPWSTKYALAAATYGMPMRAIVNEPLLLAHLRTEAIGRFGDDPPDDGAVCAFMPAVDRSLFARAERQSSDPRRLVFYARPRNQRNLFDLGLRALRTAIDEGVFDDGDWEFLSIGQDLVDLPLPGSAVLRAMPWLSYDEYAALLGRSDVLLSLMLSPHTSYPPLEMVVAGGHVVTNTFGVKSTQALEAISPAMHAARPDLRSLVDALRSAADEAAHGDPPTAPTLPATWDEALEAVVPWLDRSIREIRGG
jgi:hypothetical protein